MGKVGDFFKSLERDNSIKRLEGAIESVQKNTVNNLVDYKKADVEIKPQYKPLADFYYKRTLKKKLVIVLLEDTEEAFFYNEYINELLKEELKNCLVRIVSYNDVVFSTNIMKEEDMDYEKEIFHSTYNTSQCCLFEALRILLSLCNQKSNIQDEKFKYEIGKIELIGIGRCIDNFYENIEEDAINIFSYIVKKYNIKTKYYCLKEENIIDVAQFGFRSINVIDSKC